MNLIDGASHSTAIVASRGTSSTQAYSRKKSAPVDLHGTLVFSLLGAGFAFLGGLVALKWLSNWLENGRWYLFGIYCLVASGVVFYLHTQGY